MERGTLTKATLGRIPNYLRVLKSLSKDEYPNISATTLARILSLGEVQVRKDLNSVSGEGKPKIGYRTADLIGKLESCLGRNNLTSAVLVGVGKLGSALLDYDAFEDYGVRIIAGFDSDKEALIKTLSKEIFLMERFEEFCREKKIQIGIITTGESSAQQVCDEMVRCGISAIWNFAPCKLKAPEGVLIKQENLALSLAHLNSQLIS